MDNEKFGKFIKDLRKRNNMTQKELADKLNITDKAVSKWERGLSFPDISMLNLLAEVFHITASELLNCEIGKKEEIDVKKAIQEAVKKVTQIKEKKEKRRKIIKKVAGVISLVLFVLCSIVQLGYIFLLKKRNYEYVIDVLPYIINEVIIFSGITLSIFVIEKSKIKNRIFCNIVIALILVILTVINIALMCNIGLKKECIISFSKDFSNEVVVKKNKNTGEVIFYKDIKGYLFAKPKEQFSYEVEGKIKMQWLTNDICSLTYKDSKGELREFVATYGDRGNGISYYNMATALEGEWQVFRQYGNAIQLLADSKGITIKKDGKNQLFKYEDCKKYGTISLVLYTKEEPQYVIALNKDCKIDENTGIIKKDGTITLCEVSMEKTMSEVLYCMTYKDKADMSNYKLTDMNANEYSIKNGILYISYDGKKVIEVPGDFTNAKSSYNDYNYQISKEKTIFFYTSNQKRYLVYSDNMGENWQTVEIKKNSTIQNIHFINSNIGFMLEFEDVAMGTAFGKISKTTDGGQNWTEISYGIGEKNDKVFKTSSQIKFINENTGFLTMPATGGENSQLYITKDCGKTFSKVIVIESEIYDYYNLPTEENGKLYLKVSQGSDGDYNGNDSKEFYSEDNGNTWNINLY